MHVYAELRKCYLLLRNMQVQDGYWQMDMSHSHVYVELYTSFACAGKYKEFSYHWNFFD